MAGDKTFTGTLSAPAPTAGGHAATKDYVDSATGGGNAAVLTATQTFSGQNTFLNMVTVSSDTVLSGVLNRISDLTIGGAGYGVSFASSVTAGWFYGDGSDLSNVFSSQDAGQNAEIVQIGLDTATLRIGLVQVGVDTETLKADVDVKVAKAGDTMTGQLTISGSSLTATGAAGIGAADPAATRGCRTLGTGKSAYGWAATAARRRSCRPVTRNA